MGKIKTSEEAHRIIIETETFIKAGYDLTVEQKCRYEFAKILLKEIGKRREKQGEEGVC
jgi:hypothetical protein